MTPRTPSTTTPNDRAAFNDAMAAVRADHGVLRDLAIAASRPSNFSTDYTMSLAEAMLAHERLESRLFNLPFVSQPPEAVIATAAQARRRCTEYTSGSFQVPDAHAAGVLFIDALLAHLTVEDAWLDREEEHQKGLLRTSA